MHTSHRSKGLGCIFDYAEKSFLRRTDLGQTSTTAHNHNHKHTTTNTTTATITHTIANTQQQTKPKTQSQTRNHKHNHKHTTTSTTTNAIANATTNTQPQTQSQTQPQTHNHSHKHTTTNTQSQTHNHKRTTTNTTTATITNMQLQAHNHKHNHTHNHKPTDTNTQSQTYNHSDTSTAHSHTDATTAHPVRIWSRRFTGFITFVTGAPTGNDFFVFWDVGVWREGFPIQCGPGKKHLPRAPVLKRVHVCPYCRGGTRRLFPKIELEDVNPSSHKITYIHPIGANQPSTPSTPSSNRGKRPSSVPKQQDVTSTLDRQKCRTWWHKEIPTCSTRTRTMPFDKTCM